MALLVANCPRCGVRAITFDVKGQTWRYQKHDWQDWFEVFAVCRHCQRATIFLVGVGDFKSKDVFKRSADALVRFEGALNDHFRIEKYISLYDEATASPPKHLPKNIEDAFNEGARCLAAQCPNGGATMFRLCVALATDPLLPKAEDAGKPQPNAKQRRDLGLRLAWLLDNGILPEALRELSKCVREDGNDGAHVGNLSMAEAHDLLDFATRLLERLITEPKELELAAKRREERRRK